MAIIDKIVFSQNTPAKNTLWAKPSEKGTELLIFNKGKWGTVGRGEKGDKGDAGTTDYNDLENKPDLSIYMQEITQEQFNEIFND